MLERSVKVVKSASGDLVENGMGHSYHPRLDGTLHDILIAAIMNRYSVGVFLTQNAQICLTMVLNTLVVLCRRKIVGSCRKLAEILLIHQITCRLTSNIVILGESMRVAVTLCNSIFLAWAWCL